MIGRALLVGVADYLLVEPDLPAAVRHDVADVACALSDPAIGRLHPGMITALLDDGAGVADIRAALEHAARAATADETFLFYFSGHGTRDGEGGREQSWLLPHDADFDDLAATAIASTELVARLDAIAAKRQVILIDACHAGGIASSKSASPTPKGFGRSGIEALSQGAGRVLLTSSRPDELSGILAGARNSIFTAALLAALGGRTIDRGDGMVGVLDLFDFVSKEVPRQKRDQHPIFHAGDLETNFAIAQRRIMPPARHDGNALAQLFSGLYPAGPTDEQIWVRAGGDISQLDLSGTGRTQWYAALRKVLLGGGGLTLPALFAQAAADFPQNDEVAALIR